MVQKSQKRRPKKPRKVAQAKSKSDAVKVFRKRKIPSKKPVPRVIDLANPLERALARMKAGMDQKRAAQAEGVSQKAVRTFRKANTRSKRVGGKWTITDRRAVKMLVFSDGKIYGIPVQKKAASELGRFWNAVNRFLDTNDRSHLKPYIGVSVRDITGTDHILETDPGVLRRSDGIGDLSFHTLYRNSVV